MLRPVAATAGGPHSVDLTFSNDGESHGAFRLTAVQGGAGPGKATFAMYVAAADVDDQSFDAFVKAAGGVPLTFGSSAGTLSLRAGGLGGPLSVSLDTDRKVRSLIPSPADLGPGTFWISGQEVGAGLLGTD